MNKIGFAAVAVFIIGLLVLTGCAGGATGSVPSAPVAPSGGGCGIGAPVDSPGDVVIAAENVDAASQL